MGGIASLIWRKNWAYFKKNVKNWWLGLIGQSLSFLAPTLYVWKHFKEDKKNNNKTSAHMRQCEFKDIKLCKVKIKLIALGWYLVTMIFRCQTNPEIHCSPVMHNVQDKTKNLLYKLVKESWKFTIFGSFMVQFFLITCVCTCISLKIKL